AFILWPSRNTSTAPTSCAEAELSRLMGNHRHARGNTGLLRRDDLRAGRSVRHLAERAGALAYEALRYLRELSQRHRSVAYGRRAPHAQALHRSTRPARSRVHPASLRTATDRAS